MHAKVCRTVAEPRLTRDCSLLVYLLHTLPPLRHYDYYSYSLMMMMMMMNLLDRHQIRACFWGLGRESWSMEFSDEPAQLRTA